MKIVFLEGLPGVGKTTILRIIAGFDQASSGEILFDGQSINNVPANKRQVNTVFQDYALFPHLSVENNIKYGLKLKRIDLPRESIKQSVYVKQKNLQKK